MTSPYLGLNPPKRVAIYARYSSDLQRPNSIADQIRQCREAAAKRGWVVVEEYIRSDEAVSGRSRVGRAGLDELMTLAQSRNRPFDGIVIDDTSRFGRNLSDTLPMSDTLQCFQVFLYFANRELDSTSPNFRTLFIAYGQVDEQYSRMLGEKVHRGQRGRMLNGHSPSGRTYGYTNVPVEHPYKKGLYGRPYVEAVRLEVSPEESHTILRIFKSYVEGLGTRALAKQLNEEGVPSPLRVSSEIPRNWTTSGLKLILKNEKYRGVHIWNRTRTVYRPGMEGKMQQKRPRDQWERVEVPDWRIVPEELWAAVRQETVRRAGKVRQKQGGLNRSDASRSYIFSGLLKCGACGGRMNIVGMKNGNVRYGCSRYRFSGTCDNKMTVRRDSLEAQLVEALVKNVSRGALYDHLGDEFARQVSAALRVRMRKSEGKSESNQLRIKRQQLRQQSEHMLNAIAGGGGSTLVYERLRLIESQMETLESLLVPGPATVDVVPSKAALASYLDSETQNLTSTLLRNPQSGKLQMARYVKDLILMPKRVKEDTFYEVKGAGAAVFGAPPPDSAGKVRPSNVQRPLALLKRTAA